MNPKEITAYQCSNCGVSYIYKDAAEACCSQKKCEDCGELLPTRWCRTVCNRCHEKRRFEKAEKLESWDGYIYCAKGYGYNDGYFETVDDLIDYCHDHGLAPPKYAFVCEEQRHEIDVDAALENMLEDAYEDAGDHLQDEKELRDFIAEWNKKQYIVTYYPDYSRVVLINNGEEVSG